MSGVSKRYVRRDKSINKLRDMRRRFKIDRDDWEYCVRDVRVWPFLCVRTIRRVRGVRIRSFLVVERDVV